MHPNDRFPLDATDTSPSPAPAVPAGPREIELKLHVPVPSVARLWTHPLVVSSAIGPKTVARVENRYFDTPAGDLAAHGMALRLRRIGRSWVQTLKTRDGDGDAHERPLSTRGEWEMPVRGPALELRHLRGTPLETVASTRSLAHRLQPVFTTDFRRESQRLRLADGAEVEYAFDAGSIRTGRGNARRSLPICEVELEVKVVGSDDPALSLLRFARRVVRDVPLVALAESKAARGYRLLDRREVEGFKVALPVPLARDVASVHFASVVAACTDALLSNAHALIEQSAGTSLSAVDPEFVHQARVAIRRLRSALRTFRPIAKGRRIHAVEDTLRALGQAFGRARDWDVFMSTTMKRLDDKIAVDDAGRAALAELRAKVASHKDDAYRVLLNELDEGPFGAVAIDLMRISLAWRATPDGRSDTGPTLEACVPRWLDAQRSRIVRRSRKIAVLDRDQRHGLRVEVKRLRYALDLFEAIYDPALVATFHDALSELQDRLGKLNDEVVAERLLQSFDAVPARDLIASRYATWLAPHVGKQLPKVAAHAVAFELAQTPWSHEPSRRPT